MNEEQQLYDWERAPGESEPPGDDRIELLWGRRAPFSQLGNWVLFSGASAQACKLYWAYVAHLSSSRDDRKVWPKRETLAKILGASLDTVDRYSKELAKLGAIDIIPRRYSNGMRARNGYRIHEMPPPGYTGPMGIEDYYPPKR